MYTEKREKESFNFKSVILQFLFVALFIFILMWLFPMKSDLKKAMNASTNTTKGETTDLSIFYDQIFNNNVVSMKEAAKSYFTTPRLPQNIGDKVKLTLGDMLDKKIILPFVDSKGKQCDLEGSYVEITKYEDEFVMKVNLKCSDQENYLLVYMGCYDYCQTAICEKNKADIKTPTVYSAKTQKPVTQPVQKTEQKNINITNIVNNINNTVNNVTNNTVNIIIITPQPTPTPTPEPKKYICEYSKTTGGTTTYGEWSAWQEQEIKATSTLQVQRGKKDVTTTTYKDVITKDLSQPIYATKEVGVSKSTVTYCAEYSSSSSISYGGWQKIGYVALRYIPNDTATTRYVPVSDTTWICKSQCTAGVDHVYMMYKRTANSSNSSTKCTKTNTISYINTTNVRVVTGYKDKVTKQESKETKTIYVYRSRPVRTTGGSTQYKWDVCDLTDGTWTFTGNKKEV